MTELIQAVAQHVQGRHQRALDLRMAAIEGMQPNDPQMPGALGAAALNLDKLGRYDEASQILTRAVQVDPKNAIAHYTLAQALSKKGQYDQAVDGATLLGATTRSSSSR